MDKLSNRLISAIIVTAAIHDYFKSCVDSLKQQSYPNLEIIVINNSSQQLLEPCNSDARIKSYFIGENLSYCQSLNKGIEKSRGDFILCLNDDVILDCKFIEEALRGFGVNGNIGMVSAKILRLDKEILDSTGLFLSIYRTAKERGYGIKDKGQFEKEEYVFGVNGAVAFYRRQMLEEIKLGSEYFDSDFGFFYEDLDISWRAHNFGWKGYYIPNAVAYHIRGASVRQSKGINKKFALRYLNGQLLFDLIKNRYLVIIKNETVLNFFLYLPLLIFYDIFIWAYILFLRPQMLKIIFSRKIPIGSAFEKRRFLRKKIALLRQH